MGLTRLTHKRESGMKSGYWTPNRKEELVERLAEYEDLEEQNQLLKLPCAVGDIIWDIDFGRPYSYEVTGFSFGSMNDDDWEEERILDQVVVYYTNSNGSITGTFAVREIGKTVFLTREEAETALKEMSE
ncbi:MAG: hypothetical protein K2P21_10835 [Lachnospiraceae bacterium]|nr:hypothetical protein [Lachnospiraceae bacterium]